MKWLRRKERLAKIDKAVLRNKLEAAIIKITPGILLKGLEYLKKQAKLLERRK